MGSGSSKPSSTPLGGGSGFVKPTGVPIAETFNQVNYVLNPAPQGTKKIALLIGINYRNTVNELEGCINDANNVKTLLESWGFVCTMMTDDSSGDLYPNKVNILKKLTDMLSTLKANDAFVIYYSGHGNRIPDTSGDEISGLDSVICPVDVRSQGYITDDTLRTTLNSAAADSKILAFFDSCNSGSVCDLRFNYFDTSYRSNPGDIGSPLVVRQNVIENTKYENTAAKIITLSGCRDEEFSAEALYVNGLYGGALTYFVLKYLYENTPDRTFEDFLVTVRTGLRNKRFNQNPSLMSGKMINPSVDTIAQFLNI